MDARVGSSKEPNMAHKSDGPPGSQPSTTFSTSTSLLNITVTNTAGSFHHRCQHYDHGAELITLTLTESNHLFAPSKEIWKAPKVTRPFCLPPFCSLTSPSLGFKTV